MNYYYSTAGIDTCAISPTANTFNWVKKANTQDKLPL